MPDPGPSVADATRSVLLVIRLKAVATAPAIAVALDAMAAAMPAEAVDALLGRLELAGLVEHRSGGFPGWRLTADGRREGERLLGVELDELGIRDAVTAAYLEFLTHNGDLLRACTAWQLRDANPSAPIVNDHTDEAFDRAVIDRLGAIHTAVVPICAELAVRLPRFGAYAPRFTDAFDRITAGDVDAFDQPDVDSYHAIWFELHEHLLATTGRDRSSEPLP
jgi:hypothetical protein